MKPLSYFEQIGRMPNQADQFDLRLGIVRQDHGGIQKPAEGCEQYLPVWLSQRPGRNLRSTQRKLETTVSLISKD